MDALKALAASPYPHPDHPLPKPIIAGGAALMVATVAFCAFGHATGLGRTAEPGPVAVASRDLVFAEGDDKVLRVTDAAPDGRTVASFPDGEGGFVRATVKALTRNRALHGEPAVGAFRVSLARDGGVWLQDLGTHQDVDLRAFGPNQVAAFGQFLKPDGGAR